MSNPQRFDANRFENVPAQSSNNSAQLPNNGYQRQFDPYQASQSYGQMPAPVSYPNPVVHPPNMLFPPIDFSVPPPNFAQMNVSQASVCEAKIVLKNTSFTKSIIFLEKKK